MMNGTSENYPKFLPNFIPPPPPAGLFAIPSPPNFSTNQPPTKNSKPKGLIAGIVVLAVLLFVVIFCKCKKQPQESKHVTKNKVKSTKKTKKNNVHERDIPVYGYDRRLKNFNGRLMEARYDSQEPTRNYDYEGDLDSGIDVESAIDAKYSSSRDESDFSENNEVELVNNATKSDIPEEPNKELVIYVKDDKSDDHGGEGDTGLEGETNHDNQQRNVMELAIDATGSNVPESDSKSKDVMIPSGKSKKGKGRAR